MISWQDCQSHCAEILAAGLSTLQSSGYATQSGDLPDHAGNYLISYQGEPFYVGEANQLKRRIKQQMNPQTSTFFKTYLKSQDEARLPRGLQIQGFQVQFMLTNLGRKEIEEFSIVNLGTCLNKFQLNKRERWTQAADSALWHRVQQSAPTILKEAEYYIGLAQRSRWNDAEPTNGPGLYLVENPHGELIYVGESSSMRERYRVHSERTYFSALGRNLGFDILGFMLKTQNGKKRYFSEAEDRAVTEYLETCNVRFVPVVFARYELEEHLIRHWGPSLNRKANPNW